MSIDELRARVGWTVAEPPRGRAVGRVAEGLLKAVSTVVTFGADAGTGARRPSWDVPGDPDAYLDLGSVTLRWPAGAAAEPVRASARGVWATSASADRPPRRLPVQDWQVTGAVPDGGAASRDPEARWTLTVTDGTTTGSLSGAWLALAWIGSVAGWPEPVTIR